MARRGIQIYYKIAGTLGNPDKGGDSVADVCCNSRDGQKSIIAYYDGSLGINTALYTTADESISDPVNLSFASGENQ